MKINKVVSRRRFQCFLLLFLQAGQQTPTQKIYVKFEGFEPVPLLKRLVHAEQTICLYYTSLSGGCANGKHTLKKTKQYRRNNKRSILLFAISYVLCRLTLSTKRRWSYIRHTRLLSRGSLQDVQGTSWLWCACSAKLSRTTSTGKWR